MLLSRLLIPRIVLALMVVALLLVRVQVAISHAQDVMLHEMLGDETKTYLLTLSGTVLNNRFEHAQALMTISVAHVGADNPYVVNITGFPQVNERNRFVWYSNDSYMTYFPGMITCNVKYSYMHQPVNIHFFYASPALYERTPSGYVGITQAEEAARLADIVLLPTKVIAQAGSMTLRVSDTWVSGTVWMQGYDFVESSYVRYAASFVGRRVYGMKTKLPVPEPQPMHIIEDTDERYR